MTREELRHVLKNKLKECNKDILVDIIANLYLAYIGARIFTDINNTNCVKQSLNAIQANIQELDNFITQKVNANLYDTRK